MAAPATMPFLVMTVFVAIVVMLLLFVVLTMFARPLSFHIHTPIVFDIVGTPGIDPYEDARRRRYVAVDVDADIGCLGGTKTEGNHGYCHYQSRKNGFDAHCGPFVVSDSLLLSVGGEVITVTNSITTNVPRSWCLFPAPKVLI
jgi:hypothetical protein